MYVILKFIGDVAELLVLNRKIAFQEDIAPILLICMHQKVMNCFVDKFTAGKRDAITKSLCSFFYRTGIPFKVIESQSFKDFIKTIRPVYVDSIPSKKSVAGACLDREYNSLYERRKAFLDDTQYYSYDELANQGYLPDSQLFSNFGRCKFYFKICKGKATCLFSVSGVANKISYRSYSFLC